MRVMALDFGDVRIGIAMSDELKILATGLETYLRKDLESDINYLSELINKNRVETVVMGLPLNMDGSEGKRVEVTKQFADELLKHITAKIVYVDERLTSLEAQDLIIESVRSKKKRQQKGLVDKMAATIILQNYLDRL
ncbi:MAG: Holliday junction resolvase RuvX [Spirochaetales bacterium]